MGEGADGCARKGRSLLSLMTGSGTLKIVMSNGVETISWLVSCSYQGFFL